MSYNESIAQRGLNSIFEPLIQQCSVNYGVPTALIKAIISQESDWNPNAVNLNDPSYGLMQLNAHYWGTPEQLLVPENNINIGTRILADQLARLGDMSLAIAAYNAGTSRSAADLSQRIANNVNNVGNYVSAVLAYYNYFLSHDFSTAGGGDLPPGDTSGGGGENPPLDTSGGINQNWIIAGIVAVLALLGFAVSSR